MDFIGQMVATYSLSYSAHMYGRGLDYKLRERSGPKRVHVAKGKAKAQWRETEGE